MFTKLKQLETPTWLCLEFPIQMVEKRLNRNNVSHSFVCISGTKHVTEIANMALDLVESSSNFIIPHRPDKKLLIRAGVNSGPAVAGKRIVEFNE